MDSMLFSPLQIRSIALKNRIVLSPMMRYCADKGHVNDRHLCSIAGQSLGYWLGKCTANREGIKDSSWQRGINGQN